MKSIIYLLATVFLLFGSCSNSGGEETPRSPFEGRYSGTFTIDDFYLHPIYDDDFIWVRDSIYATEDEYPCEVTITADGSTLRVSGCDYDFEFEEEPDVFFYELFGCFAWWPISTDHFRVTLDETHTILDIDDHKQEPVGQRRHRFVGAKQEWGGD